MDPLVGGAIIGGASSIISNIFGSRNQDKANDMNLRINQMNNEFNARQAELAFQRESQYNDRIRAEDRAYNSAAAQAERYRQAGLNPTLMMQGQGAGTASSNGVSASAASASGNATMGAFRPDFTGLQNTLLGFQELRQQKEFQDEQLNGMRIENQYKAQKAIAEIYNMYADTNDKRAKALLNKTLAAWKPVEMRNQTITAEANARSANEAAELAIAEKNLKKKELEYFDQSKRLEMNLLSAEIALKIANKTFTLQQARTEWYKQAKLSFETTHQRQQNALLDRTFEALVEKTIQDTLPDIGFYGRNHGDWLSSRNYGYYPTFIEKNRYKSGYGTNF